MTCNMAASCKRDRHRHRITRFASCLLSALVLPALLRRLQLLSAWLGRVRLLLHRRILSSGISRWTHSACRRSSQACDGQIARLETILEAALALENPHGCKSGRHQWGGTSCCDLAAAAAASAGVAPAGAPSRGSGGFASAGGCGCDMGGGLAGPCECHRCQHYTRCPVVQYYVRPVTVILLLCVMLRSRCPATRL